MPVDYNYPKITMPLFETDMCTLQKFIINEKLEGALTENYLILYNFAADCIYSKSIQPELIRYLLPFYLKSVEQAVTDKNRIAMDIYCNFNSAIFINQRNIKQAIGEESFQYVMEFYVDQTINAMGMKSVSILDWISLFNTTVAFGNDNIILLFQEILRGSLKIKYSFFIYLSILLFKESDNLLVTNELEDYWTDYVWCFDSQVSNDLFWSDDIVKYLDREISKERVESLFKEIKPLLRDILGVELIDLVSGEISQSLATGTFYDRKTEYLKRMNCKSDKYKNWNRY